MPPPTLFSKRSTSRTFHSRRTSGGLRSQQFFCLAAGLFRGGRAIRRSSLLRSLHPLPAHRPKLAGRKRRNPRREKKRLFWVWLGCLFSRFQVIFQKQAKFQQ